MERISDRAKCLQYNEILNWIIKLFMERMIRTWQNNLHLIRLFELCLAFISLI
jgi:hypothetical protein